MSDDKIVYVAEIVWKKGDRLIVGVYDDPDVAVAETIDYYATVRGESTHYRHPEWTHGAYNTRMIELVFEHDYPATEHTSAYTVTGHGFISGTPMNATFSGSLMPTGDKN